MATQCAHVRQLTTTECGHVSQPEIIQFAHVRQPTATQCAHTKYNNHILWTWKIGSNTSHLSAIASVHTGGAFDAQSKHVLNLPQQCRLLAMNIL